MSIFALGLLLAGVACGQEPGLAPTTDVPADLAAFFAPPEKYRSDFGRFRSPLLFADGRQVRSPADWRRRRTEILSTWHRLMGPWPPLIDKPEVEVVQTTVRDNITQHNSGFKLRSAAKKWMRCCCFPGANRHR